MSMKRVYYKYKEPFSYLLYPTFPYSTIRYQQSALTKSPVIQKSQAKISSRSLQNQNTMSQNRGAVNPAARTPLEVRPLDSRTPGPSDILVKNEIIAINPVEVSITKNDLFKSKYPCVIGTSFGGQVVAVGEGVSDFKVGDKVAVYASPTDGDKYAAYQAYALAKVDKTILVPETVDLAVPVSMNGNLTTVVGMISATAGVPKPDIENEVASTGKKILIYGGTSNLGSLAVQYVRRAGYSVVTTTSPKHKAFVETLGADKVIDHSQDRDTLIKAFIAEGPYDIVVDTISHPNTVSILADVLAAQGGGTVYATRPAFGPETLPEGVVRHFTSWPFVLYKEGNEHFIRWAFHEFFAKGVASGKLVPTQIERVRGGFEAINSALDILGKGVSNSKVVVELEK
ncbi:zinc-binding alcohol dehydrogenase domain-containing protein [Fusarium pseudocircinatum]|uniref:Zinc-binding alcohol dehydrogenase domain-containing protein n=1 Tax=Fusarium pseudocircinatum TaxID=56676 RepID=A0A8H5KYE9_9HYPO|nr:zinc-binding alcohol dehydrogenase domain-containing protein [Fusarium pseudocircinatum]